MGMINDAITALKNVILMQSGLEQLQKQVERQDRDIAGLRDAISAISERVARFETKFEIYERLTDSRRNGG